MINKIITTIKNIPAKQSFTYTDDASITNWFKTSCLSATELINFNFPELNFSTKFINHGVF